MYRLSDLNSISTLSAKYLLNFYFNAISRNSMQFLNAFLNNDASPKSILIKKTE